MLICLVSACALLRFVLREDEIDATAARVEQLRKMDLIGQAVTKSASETEAIIHFAASVVVPESVRDPLAYYRNNTMNTRALIECAVNNGVRQSRRKVWRRAMLFYTGKSPPGSQVCGESTGY